MYVRSLKNQGSVVVRREEREFNFAAVGFFPWAKKRTKNLTPGSEGGKEERKLRTPLSPPKCEEM